MESIHILRWIMGSAFILLSLLTLGGSLAHSQIFRAGLWSLLGFLIGLRYIWPEFFTFGIPGLLILRLVLSTLIGLWLTFQIRARRRIGSDLIPAALIVLNLWIPGG